MLVSFSVQFQNLWDYCHFSISQKVKVFFHKTFRNMRVMSANKFLQLRVDTWSRKLNIILSLSFQDKTSTKKQQHILEAIRVTSSKTFPQNMPTFQSPQDKATRPKVKFYNIYMVASGPNHLKF